MQFGGEFREPFADYLISDQVELTRWSAGAFLSGFRVVGPPKN